MPLSPISLEMCLPTLTMGQGHIGGSSNDLVAPVWDLRSIAESSASGDIDVT